MDVEVSRALVKFYPRWLSAVKKACNARSLELRDAKVRFMNREQWMELVNEMNNGINA